MNFKLNVTVLLNHGGCYKLYLVLYTSSDDFQFLINRWPITSQAFTLWRTHSKYEFNCPRGSWGKM